MKAKIYVGGRHHSDVEIGTPPIGHFPRILILYETSNYPDRPPQIHPVYFQQRENKPDCDVYDKEFPVFGMLPLHPPE